MMYMDTISSADFRKTYAKLRHVTTVTANGHIIGQWTPAVIQSVTTEPLPDEAELIAPFASKPNTPEREAEIAERHGFNSRPFTPVPKKGK